MPTNANGSPVAGSPHRLILKHQDRIANVLEDTSKNIHVGRIEETLNTERTVDGDIEDFSPFATTVVLSHRKRQVSRHTTGDAPIVSAVSLTQISCSATKGWSYTRSFSVARFGASRISSVKDF